MGFSFKKRNPIVVKSKDAYRPKTDGDESLRRSAGNQDVATKLSGEGNANLLPDIVERCLSFPEQYCFDWQQSHQRPKFSHYWRSIVVAT